MLSTLTWENSLPRLENSNCRKRHLDSEKEKKEKEREKPREKKHHDRSDRKSDHKKSKHHSSHHSPAKDRNQMQYKWM